MEAFQQFHSAILMLVVFVGMVCGLVGFFAGVEFMRIRHANLPK